jgi:RHS repeat-associated protein
LDRLNSITAQSDEAGILIDVASYSPFGESDTLTNCAFGFTGQRFDADTQLYHYKTRTYSPELGRFLQPDLAGYVSGLNLYSYLINNPFISTDPFGLTFWEDLQKWLTRSATESVYGPDSPETKLVQESVLGTYIQSQVITEHEAALKLYGAHSQTVKMDTFDAIWKTLIPSVGYTMLSTLFPLSYPPTTGDNLIFSGLPVAWLGAANIGIRRLNASSSKLTVTVSNTISWNSLLLHLGDSPAAEGASGRIGKLWEYFGYASLGAGLIGLDQIRANIARLDEVYPPFTQTFSWEIDIQPCPLQMTTSPGNGQAGKKFTVPPGLECPAI